GYPNGTVGRRLLLIAQVIPVADSLDAMTSARAYRGARTWESALEELRRGAGTQWNPHVVEAALAALGQAERAPAREASATPALGRDPRAVGVAEQDVVVVRQQTNRRRCVSVRARGSRRVEELGAS